MAIAPAGILAALDSFAGVNGAAPAAQWTATLGTGATAQTQSNRMVLTPGTGAYSAAPASLWNTGCAAFTNTYWDIVCQVQLNTAAVVGQYAAVGVSTNGTLRSGDVLPGNGYAVELIPGTGFFNFSRVTTGSVANLSTNIAYTYTAGTPVNVRLQQAAGVLSVWLWNAGTPMPAAPNWTGTDAAPLTGTLKPILSASNGSATTPVASSFANFVVATGAGALAGPIAASDDFPGTSGAWSAQWTPTLGAGAVADLSGNTGRLTPGSGAYAAATASEWLTGIPAAGANSDWDLQCTVYPANPIVGQYIAVGLSTNGTLRSGDVLPGAGYGVELIPASGSFNVNRIIAGTVTKLSGSDLPYTYLPGVGVNVRFQRQNQTFNVWVWNNLIGAQPAAPSFTILDPTPLGQPVSPILAAENGASATPAAAAFDNFVYSIIATGVYVFNGTTFIPGVFNAYTGSAFVPAPFQATS